MTSGTQMVPLSRMSLWAGRIVSVIPALVLVFGGIMKLLRLPSVLQGFTQYGYPANSLPVIGILEVGSTVVYLIPRTAVLGAILMTGVLGGAIASNVRIADPAFSAPLVLGVLVWGGLYLREPRLRALIPRREHAARDNS